MKLERENIKLLVTNVEMAEETKNLILEKKQWKKIEQVKFLILMSVCERILFISII